jgi:hypothetical protein
VMLLEPGVTVTVGVVFDGCVEVVEPPPPPPHAVTQKPTRILNQNAARRPLLLIVQPHPTTGIRFDLPIPGRCSAIWLKRFSLAKRMACVPAWVECLLIDCQTQSDGRPVLRRSLYESVCRELNQIVFRMPLYLAQVPGYVRNLGGATKCTQSGRVLN